MELPLLHLNKFKDIVESLLSKNCPFVIFKKPNEPDIFLLAENTLQAVNAFVLQGFNENDHYVISGALYKNEEIIDVEIPSNFNPIIYSETTHTYYQSQDDYVQYVEQIVNEIKNGKFKKVVAARKKKIDKPATFNAFNCFTTLCEKYPTAFVSMHHSPMGLWLGATPELLLKHYNGKLETFSLAGTKLKAEQRTWTQKEIEEQQFVTDFIVNELIKVKTVNIEISKTFTAEAGHLEHLKSVITCQSSNPSEILHALHPTPAVCGIPKVEAAHFINENEKYQRRLYSGYLGLQGEDTFYYVNLRCMQIFDQHIDIHIGAGITEHSIADAEWRETENKAQTLLTVLNT